MDLIGELVTAREFLTCLRSQGYAVELTTPDALAIRMLPDPCHVFWGVTTPWFWLYALYHFHSTA
jgi:hypothetical protein